MPAARAQNDAGIELGGFSMYVCACATEQAFVLVKSIGGAKGLRLYIYAYLHALVSIWNFYQKNKTYEYLEFSWKNRYFSNNDHPVRIFILGCSVFL